MELFFVKITKNISSLDFAAGCFIFTKKNCWYPSNAVKCALLLEEHCVVPQKTALHSSVKGNMWLNSYARHFSGFISCHTATERKKIHFLENFFSSVTKNLVDF